MEMKSDDVMIICKLLSKIIDEVGQIEPDFDLVQRSENLILSILRGLVDEKG